MHCDQHLKTLKVLFVEDEESLLQLLVSALGNRFLRYETAINGKEGLEKTKSFQPDIIISDITMPYMDGLTMAEKIHLENPTLPIIILSAYSDKEKLLHAIDVHVSKYFIKPFDPDELLAYLCLLGATIQKAQHIQLIDPFRYDTHIKKILKEGKVLRLTTRELTLIDHLVKAPGHIISTAKIKELIGKEAPASDESMRVFIRRLREKTDKDLIRNLPKQGYVLQMP